MQHLYSIDLESWVTAERIRHKGLTPSARKALDHGQIVKQVDGLLRILNRHDTRLTFFVCSEIYDWWPTVVRHIQAEGHEIGWHTHSHWAASDIESLERELELAEPFLEEFHPQGFQAPAINMCRLAYGLLHQRGFTYSSSVYGDSATLFVVDGVVEIPVSTRVYGTPTSPGTALPRTMTLSMLKSEIPFGSSYFIGLLGWRAINRFVRGYERQGKSANLFMHNWQLVWEGGRAFRNRFMETLRQPMFLPYLRLVNRDFEQLLTRFEFVRFDQFLKNTAFAGYAR